MPKAATWNITGANGDARLLRLRCMHVLAVSLLRTHRFKTGVGVVWWGELVASMRMIRCGEEFLTTLSSFFVSYCPPASKLTTTACQPVLTRFAAAAAAASPSLKYIDRQRPGELLLDRQRHAPKEHNISRQCTMYRKACIITKTPDGAPGRTHIGIGYCKTHQTAQRICLCNYRTGSWPSS